jgi:hypothetical protein
MKLGKIVEFLLALVLCMFMLWGLLTLFAFKEDKDCELTTQCIKEELISQNIYFPEVVLRIGILETGWWKSSACIKQHNLFGFMLNGKIISFKSYKECIHYYHEWEMKHWNFKENYLDFLKRIHYFTDKNYISKLKQIKI